MQSKRPLYNFSNSPSDSSLKISEDEIDRYLIGSLLNIDITPVPPLIRSKAMKSEHIIDNDGSDKTCSLFESLCISPDIDTNANDSDDEATDSDNDNDSDNDLDHINTQSLSTLMYQHLTN
jgi:hypothetical protein